ncbi:MAG: DNA (cytosine-5-)-methyltransferase [Candidatus Firestonebacteria bacterium]
MENNRLTYISLFSGGGIGCFGFNQEGFDCIATNEIIEKRLNIQKYNKICKYKSGYIGGDIKEDYIKKAIFLEIKKWKNKERLSEVDVLVATPPCQGISIANHKKKNEKDRNSLIVESIKLTKEVNPKFFVFENVKSFLNTICIDIDNKDKPIKEVIERNLAGNYNILYKVINFRDYGNNSSRTRTLVIGARKDIKEVNPYDVFPEKKSGKILKETIGELPRLEIMGEISKNDFYHSFRPYKKYMMDWIKDLKEGESAFGNKDPNKRPHRIVNGEKINNKNKNGDKYTRCFWNKIGPCIHTRNDVLASQSTIHPSDNRVFSIRELMKLMTIPDNFKWVDLDLDTINSLNLNEKRKLLSVNELNIRQSIGEAVPTVIFTQIAKKIKKITNKNFLDAKKTKEIIEKNNLKDASKLKDYIKINLDNYFLPDLFKISELANSQRISNSAFYTKQNICFSLLKELPDFKEKKYIRILEPSVGVGNFLPLIIKKYEHVEEVDIDVIDLDKSALDVLKILIKKIRVPKNFKINFINSDFLMTNFNSRYDLIIGNPPFGKVKNNPKLLEKYKLDKFNKKTNNICSFFLEKAIKNGDWVALILPKSILSAPEFDDTRKLLSDYAFKTLIDYGEKGFKEVKIETISIILNTKRVKVDNIIKIESYITNSIYFKEQKYIFSNNFPVWLIYRNNFFDDICRKLKFGLFNVFRDRKITKKHTKNKGKIRVLKSRNIANNHILDIKNYDTYIDSLENLQVSKFINKENVVLVPNLTYNPRACFLAKKSITDGSVAILTPKVDELISKEDLEYYNSKEFKDFYLLSRNLGTRSLNIDKNSVYFFGVLKR